MSEAVERATEAIVEKYDAADTDCANCLMPIEVMDVVFDGNLEVVDVVFKHTATDEIACEDQDEPYNTATPRI